MLHIHRAERADGLVDALRELLLVPLPDAFAPEVIAVPTRGMERWLSQRISARLGVSPGRHDGVCANVDFPSPRKLIGGAVAAATGTNPDTDPWLPERVVWPLLAVTDESLGESWLETLAAHVGGTEETPDGGRRARRFSSLRRLATLFDRYALHRPTMVRAWASGHDTDAAGRDLPNESAWQAELWRRLRDRVPEGDPVERLDAACARMREDPGVVSLPGRVSLFGLTRLPAAHLHVLRALADGRDVHLFVLHPSPVLWERVAEVTKRRPSIVRRPEDETAMLPENRLLASWGHDARELQLLLGATHDHVDHHHRVENAVDTLLARVQADVRFDRAPPGTPLPGKGDIRSEVDPEDRRCCFPA